MSKIGGDCLTYFVDSQTKEATLHTALVETWGGEDFTTF